MGQELTAVASPLLRRLRDPAAYPHEVDRVEVHETHISWVFLAGSFAYKVKKPVRFEFLDFSTLERREYFCREEVRLNRRFVEDLYLDVVPLWACGADGPGPFVPRSDRAPAEFAVRMRRFDAGRRLDALLEAGCWTGETVDELATYVARIHGEAPVAPPTGEVAEPSSTLHALRASIDEIESVRARVRGLSAPNRIPDWVESATRRYGCLLADRLGEGFVRECHGDLHLSNLFVADTAGGPGIRAYDCIEFDLSLRWIDVVNDAAFPFMDLLVRNRTAYAYRFLDRYLAATGDYAGLHALRLYVVYRTVVRAKVAALQFAAGSREAAAGRYERHLALANAWIEPPRPVLAITTGLSGSGKSTIAAALLERLPAVRIRSDVERRREFGRAADRYSPAVSGEVYRHLGRTARGLLADGYSVLVDAAFLDRASRLRFRSLAEDAGVPFRAIWCRAPAATLEDRVRRRSASGRDASEADLDVLEAQRAVAESPASDESHTTIEVDTGASPDLDRLADAVRR